MQVNITGHHVELTDALRDYVNEKLERVERHYDNITTVQVTLSVEKERQQAAPQASVVARGELLGGGRRERPQVAVGPRRRAEAEQQPCRL